MGVPIMPVNLNVTRHKNEIVALGNRCGYHFEQEQADIGLLIFTKLHPKHGPVQVNVYTTRMTVATCLDHPKSGKTQMFRRGVTLPELEQLFRNPRQHTGRGYREKK